MAKRKKKLTFWQEMALLAGCLVIEQNVSPQFRPLFERALLRAVV